MSTYEIPTDREYKCLQMTEKAVLADMEVRVAGMYDYLEINEADVFHELVGLEFQQEFREQKWGEYEKSLRDWYKKLLETKRRLNIPITEMQIKRIHTMSHKLNMMDPEYREMLEKVAGVGSCKVMNWPQAELVIQQLKIKSEKLKMEEAKNGQ